MSESSRYQTILENLGALLAAQGARKIAILDEGGFLSVSWQSNDGERQRRCFREADLARREPTVQGGQSGKSSPAALLGLLGRELDRREVDVARIEETTASFDISGSICGKYAHERVGYRDLDERRALQAPTADQAIRLSQRQLQAVPHAQPMPVPLSTHDSPLRRRLQLRV